MQSYEFVTDDGTIKINVDEHINGVAYFKEHDLETEITNGIFVHPQFYHQYRFHHYPDAIYPCAFVDKHVWKTMGYVSLTQKGA